MLNKKLFQTILTILVLDVVILGGWVFYLDPDPSITIALIFLIPIVFIINIVIATIIYFIKKYYTPFFIINAFISALMMYLFFIWGIDIHKKRVYESWEFTINNVNYTIDCNSLDNYSTYHVTYSTEVGCSSGLTRGTVHMRNDTVYFLDVDSSSFYIYDNYMYGFRNKDKVKIKKKY